MSCFPCIFRKRESLGQQFVQGHEGIENVRFFSYKELRNATKDFNPENKVGEGGFGSVYKGTLRNGTVVGIKVLSKESRQGVREFLTELTVISDIVHENLVRLYGCCVEGNHRILVYNYLENNSLAQTLLGGNRNNIQFNWRTRSKICIGVASGLAFLHEEVQPHIVHRDIKASNILLDKDLTPKISDFGLAKLLPPNTTHLSTRVAGTVGYLAPEYAIRGQVTRKSDVYSFGVLLLEIISGRCNINTRLPYEEQFLLERNARGIWRDRLGIRSILFPQSNLISRLLLSCYTTWALYECGELVKIVDAFFSDELEIKEACMFLKVGLLCTQDASKLRPQMSSVVKMLTGERDVESEKITKPGLVTDFMDIKIKSHMNTSSTSSCLENSPSSLGTTAQASVTFTTIIARD